MWKDSLIKDQHPPAQRLIGFSQENISWCGSVFIVLSQKNRVSEGYPAGGERQWVALSQASYRIYQTPTKEWEKTCFRKKIMLKWRVYA